MSLNAYQWTPWDREKRDPPVQGDMRGPYVMEGRTRLQLTPLCWVVTEDDGHVHVHPPSWKGDVDEETA